MIDIKFSDYFNEGNIHTLGYGIIGCFFMWLFGTHDKDAQINIINAACRRLSSQ